MCPRVSEFANSQQFTIPNYRKCSQTLAPRRTVGGNNIATLGLLGLTSIPRAPPGSMLFDWRAPPAPPNSMLKVFGHGVGYTGAPKKIQH